MPTLKLQNIYILGATIFSPKEKKLKEYKKDNMPMKSFPLTLAFHWLEHYLDSTQSLCKSNVTLVIHIIRQNSLV